MQPWQVANIGIPGCEEGSHVDDGVKLNSPTNLLRLMERPRNHCTVKCKQAAARCHKGKKHLSCTGRY